MNQIKIGKFISECRKAHKLTQEELAEKLGVNSRSVSRWENGQNMPDLTLYEPICKELEITINEFLSGERIENNNYQQEFEKNIIEVVNNVEIENKRSNLILNLFIGLILLICIWFVCYVFYLNFEFKQKFDANSMVIEKMNDSNNLMFNTKESGTLKYLILNTNNDNEQTGIIFVSFYQSLENMYESTKELKGNYIDLTQDNHIGHSINIENSNITNNFRVYYTTINFSKIANSNTKELNNIIKNSHLIYKS